MFPTITIFLSYFEIDNSIMILSQYSHPWMISVLFRQIQTSSFKILVDFLHNCIPTLFHSLTRNLLTDNLNSSKFFRQNFLLSQICKFPSHEVCKIQKGTVLSFINLSKSTVHFIIMISEFTHSDGNFVNFTQFNYSHSILTI